LIESSSWVAHKLGAKTLRTSKSSVYVMDIIAQIIDITSQEGSRALEAVRPSIAFRHPPTDLSSETLMSRSHDSYMHEQSQRPAGRITAGAKTSPGWHEPKTPGGSVPGPATTAVANRVGSDTEPRSMVRVFRDADMKQCLQIACKARRADVGLRLSVGGGGGRAGGHAGAAA
jgi:hypothetical protein